MLKLRINSLVAVDLKGIRDYIAEDNEEYVEIYRVVNRYQDITKLFE